MYRDNAGESLGTQAQVRRQCPEEHCSAAQRALHDDSREHRSESSAFTLDDLALTSHGAQVDYHDQNHFSAKCAQPPSASCWSIAGMRAAIGGVPNWKA